MFAQEYLVKSFGAKQGLASAEIYTLFQDDDGYIWLGTRLGVSKFDGISFVNYNGSNDLRFGKVSAITQDANRTIWIGCENGLFYFEEGIFKHVAFDSRFPDSWIYALNADVENKLWIGTSDGPVLIEEQQIQKIKSGDTLAFKLLSNWSQLSDPSNQVFTITTKKQNNEIITYFGTRNSVIQLKNNEFAIRWFSREPRLEDVSAIKVTNHNKLLIGNKSGFYYKESNTGFDTIHDFTYA
ncbi:MAG TPA: two-component regulator propeller domain-containing protein, partial [Chitinophagales bacterium]|nr:two-component regulator propeller domain-containing protein [Chitinophagales bacterium]